MPWRRENQPTAYCSLDGLTVGCAWKRGKHCLPSGPRPVAERVKGEVILPTFLRNDSKITTVFPVPLTLPSRQRGEGSGEVIFEPFLRQKNVEQVMNKLTGLPNELEVVDTTLRDGEQMPGIAYSRRQKRKLARLLAESGVDELEVGIPAMGPSIVATIRELVALQLPSRLTAWCRGAGARSRGRIRVWCACRSRLLPGVRSTSRHTRKG